MCKWPDLSNTDSSTKCVKESEIIVITGSPNSDRAAVVREMGKSGHNVTPDEHEVSRIPVSSISIGYFAF